MGMNLVFPSGGSTDFLVDAPLFGYKSTIILAVRILKSIDGQYRIWDNGVANDRRLCTCTVYMPIATAANLIDKCVNTSRGKSFDLKLTSGCGFYPFGPDKGDNGTFQCAFTKAPEQSSIDPAPIGYTRVNLEFTHIGVYPAFSLPTPNPQGNLSIGSAANLRWPDSYHTPGYQYSLANGVTGSGSVYTIDRTKEQDTYEAELPLIQNYANMALLINEVANVRESKIQIAPPVNSYMFGVENNSTHSYGCFLIQNVIEVVHETFDRFSTTLRFWRKDNG